VIPLHTNKIKYIQNSFRTEINAQRISALNKLTAIDQTIYSQNEITYLQSIIQLFNDSSFLTRTPLEIEVIKQRTGPLPQPSLTDPNGKLLKFQLTDHIQKALNYTALRKNFYPKYFRSIGIKSCIYCNSQLTVSIAKIANKIDARLEVDHYYPKDDFPYLSISLFNLYPCCSSCNKRKKKNLVNFKLYTDEISKLSKSEFNFSITKSSECDYLVTKDIDSIEIVFDDSSAPLTGYKSLQDAFSIREIHATQKDIISELIIKNQIYNESFKRTLKNNFSKLSLSQNDFDRVIIGNYTKDKDIHKRPFSKMTMDIAKQLGLIKKEY